MRFTVSPGDARRIAEYLRDGHFDLAIAFLRQPSPELRQTVLYPQKLVCIARKGHPEIKGRLSLKQFSAQSHAVWGGSPVPYPTMEAMIDEALRSKGLSRQIALHVSNVILLTNIVAKTNMLAVVPEPLAVTSRQTMPIQILPLPFQVQRADVSMLWHDRLHHDPAHKWLRTTLRKIGKMLVTAGLPTVSNP
jgi:LysR family transcriptional activator of mexEF-oprN operon